MPNEADTILGSNIAPEAAAPVVRAPRKPSTVGMPKTTRILIEENDSIPPTGIFVGVNGKGYIIRPGEPVDVPPGVLDVLNNAVETTAQIDPLTRRVVGYRERMRYPYRQL